MQLFQYFKIYGQLKNRYPNDVWQEIIGNCDLRLNMGTTDVLTATYFSSAIGVSSIESSSIRKSASIEGKLAEYGQENISTLRRNLLNADEILRLPSNKLLVLIRGNNPLLLDKVIYKEHPIAKKLKDTPISEYKPSWYTNENNSNKLIQKEENGLTNKNNLQKGFEFY